jgi:tRNA A58 N-methylase Trm61
MARVPLSHRRSDGLEFEVTSIDQARDALEELPLGMKARSRSDASDSTFRRKPITARDRIVSPQAWSWLESLPSEVRPKALVVQFPHVVNQLALLWRSDADCLHHLRNLMIDERGGRRGFPVAVADEISKLYDWCEKSIRDAE